MNRSATYWRCKHCNRFDIEHDKSNCPNCGRLRDSATVFYTQESLEYETYPPKALFLENADWICSYCEAVNSLRLDSCKACGALQENSVNLRKNKMPVPPLKEETVKKADTPVPKKPESIDKEGESNKSTLKFLIGICVIWVIALFTYRLIPFLTVATVTDLFWEREILIENEVTVAESGWDLPPTARLTGTEQEIHHYEEVFDHYEMRVDNRGEHTMVPVYRQDPRLATKYYYDIEQWVPCRTESEKGNDEKPVWPHPLFAANEREYARTKLYGMTVNGPQGTKVYRIDYSLWKELKVGNKLKIVEHNDGSVQYSVMENNTSAS